MKVIIDGDYHVYATGFALDGESEVWAFHQIKRKLAEIQKDCMATEFELYIGGEGNFRDDLFSVTEYMAGRSPRPALYDRIRDYLISHHDAELSSGMEVDDVCSIRMWTDWLESGGDKDEASLVLSSPDKDLNNVPGWHYNPTKRTLKWVTEEESAAFFWHQMLMGDRTDNIPGLPYCASETIAQHKLGAWAKKGCGEKTAKAIHDTVGATDDFKVIPAYCEWGNQELMDKQDISDYITLQGQLLWMVRELHGDGSPVMWELDSELFESIYSKCAEASSGY